MEDAIAPRCGDIGKTRGSSAGRGSPIDLADLAIVNPQEARSIIVLSPERRGPRRRGDQDDPGADPRARTGASEPYHIVAEIQDPTNLEAARLVGGDEAVLIDKSRDDLAPDRADLAAVRAVVVYTELLDFDGDEIYFRERPVARAAGRSARRCSAYEDCSVIGIASAAGDVKLNPPAGHRRSARATGSIAIAEDDSAARDRRAELDGTVDEDAIVARAAARSDRRSGR